MRGAAVDQAAGVGNADLPDMFGLPAAGKNHVGELLAAHFGYLFVDADNW